jgi:hypothetical protein
MAHEQHTVAPRREELPLCRISIAGFLAVINIKSKINDIYMTRVEPGNMMLSYWHGTDLPLWDASVVIILRNYFDAGGRGLYW